MAILKDGERFYRDGVPKPCSFDVLEQWDYEKLAEAFHGRGFKVSTHRELELCLAEVLQLNVPALVAIKLDPHDLPRGIQAVVSTPRLRAAFADGSAQTIGTPPAEHIDVSFGELN